MNEKLVVGWDQLAWPEYCVGLQTLNPNICPGDILATSNRGIANFYMIKSIGIVGGLYSTSRQYFQFGTNVKIYHYPPKV